MSKITSIGTAVPAYKHEQEQILLFMQRMYAFTEADKRKMRFLYHQSNIRSRYSVIGDYTRPMQDWKFYHQSEGLEPFPSLEQRMDLYNKHAAPLSVDAIRNCIGNRIHPNEITHLITVSCTGMSAPGLDLQIMEMMDLPRNIFRTSVNFMGCYAGIHGLKLADLICSRDPHAKVIVVCTELCTLHFQKEATRDNIASSLLFGDGSAAVLITAEEFEGKGLKISGFYSEILARGKRDMAWELSSTGFQMTLSNYVPELIEEDFEALANRALLKNGLTKEDIHHWCIHPGGKKILEAVSKNLHSTRSNLEESYSVMEEFGNMSSPTIFFVLKRMMDKIDYPQHSRVFAAAFGPGLTMETFLAESV